jgi:hypothetical protein
MSKHPELVENLAEEMRHMLEKGAELVDGGGHTGNLGKSTFVLHDEGPDSGQRCWYW